MTGMERVQEVRWPLTPEGPVTIAPGAKLRIVIQPICKVFRPRELVVESCSGPYTSILVESILTGRTECLPDGHGFPLSRIHRNTGIGFFAIRREDREESFVLLKNVGDTVISVSLRIEGVGIVE